MGKSDLESRGGEALADTPAETPSGHAVPESHQLGVLSGLVRLDLDVAAEVEAVKPLMRDLIARAEGLENHPGLQEVAGFFDGMIAEMKFQDSGFFKSPKLLDYFVERLNVFLRSLEHNINQLKATIANLRESAVLYYLPDEWEEVLKKACYTAFFVHFGQKRHAETDQTGKVQDYICHPMRVLFKHSINKQHEFSLRRWIIAVLHDTHEDIHKGFLNIMMLEGKDLSVSKALYGQDSKEKARPKVGQAVAILGRQEAALQQEYAAAVTVKRPESAPALLASELTISEGLDVLTNDTGDRGKGIVHMFETAFRLADMEGRGRLLCAINDILQIKNGGDRVDNVRTSGIRGSALKIHAETLHIFCRLCRQTGMLNVADWHFDYLYAVGHAEIYRAIMQLRRDADLKRGKVTEEGDMDSEVLPATEEFRQEFLMKMREKTAIPDLNFGEHFTLVFRPVGQRFRDIEESKRDLAEDDAAKDLRNYVIFFPIGNNTNLAEIARQVFREMTVEGFDDAIYYDEIDQTFLGRTMVDVDEPIVDQKHGAVGTSDKYGTVVWRSFLSEESAALHILGYPYVLEKYGAVPGADRAGLMLDELGERLESLTDNIRQWVKVLGVDYERIDAFVEGKEREIKDLFYDYMHQKVMTMFLETVKFQFTIAMRGQDIETVETEVPRALYESCRSSGSYDALVAYARPEFLGRVTMRTRADGSLRFFIIDGHSNVTAWSQSVREASSILARVLKGEENKLLFEEFPLKG